MICDDCEYKEYHVENYGRKGFCPFDVRFPVYIENKKVAGCTKTKKNNILATIGVV